MIEPISNNKRIAKNSLFLYIRMLLIMLVTLYTSRVVLSILGVDDYGIYNVVGTVVVLFSFLNTSMVTATQRFLNYEMGKNNGSNSIRDVFSMSLNCHLFIVTLILLFGETIGLWLLKSLVNIPEGRIVAANWVYQFSLLTTCFNVLTAPFNASIIACEKMSIYAYISIIEAILKLVVAFSIIWISSDKLIFYSSLLLLLSLFISILYIAYCVKKISFCQYKLFWDTALFKKIIGFSGWSLLGGISNIGAVQGLGIIVNMFFGVAVNAAMGIANQVNSALSMFVSNFATAFNPQVIKTYSAGETDSFFRMLYTTSRFCYLLYFTLCLPILFYCDTILYLWLKEVPVYATQFCQLVILISLVDSINTPLWTAVRAHGNIKKYNIVTSILRLSTLPICYLGFKYGLSPIFALCANLGLNIIIQSWVVFHVRELVGLSIRKHFSESLFPCIVVSIISLPLPILLKNICNSLFTNVLSFFAVALLTIVVVLFLGVKNNERSLAINYIKSKILNERN